MCNLAWYNISWQSFLSSCTLLILTTVLLPSDFVAFVPNTSIQAQTDGRDGYGYSTTGSIATATARGGDHFISHLVWHIPWQSFSSFNQLILIIALLRLLDFVINVPRALLHSQIGGWDRDSTTGFIAYVRGGEYFIGWLDWFRDTPCQISSSLAKFILALLRIHDIILVILQTFACGRDRDSTTGSVGTTRGGENFIHGLA